MEPDPQGMDECKDCSGFAEEINCCMAAITRAAVTGMPPLCLLVSAGQWQEVAEVCQGQRMQMGTTWSLHAGSWLIACKLLQR